ncbi:uncharacterized protein BKCO1_1010005 [Diplodia corticola]|uniref:Uncharacterized protein n=1 Tax=Diplodia corticola TaxID=236234 RepID=A0A1J9QJC0_9PEZI|nr:uncharacterized protein BKCO1_1010005 [Diplodia corticola]OJD28958.1 hypothetical protein BKCO1_1010005 [Diplodia corticola]
MSSFFPLSLPSNSPCNDTLDRFMDEICEEHWIHWSTLMNIVAIYRCIAGEPSYGILDSLCFYGNRNPGDTWSAEVEDLITRLENTSSELHILKLSMPHDFTKRVCDRLRQKDPGLFRRMQTVVRPDSPVARNIHKWILMIILFKTWRITFSDCNVLFGDVWGKPRPPAPLEWRPVCPPSHTSTAYLRDRLAILSKNRGFPPPEEQPEDPEEQPEDQGLFSRRTIIRILYLENSSAGSLSTDHLNLIFFQETGSSGGKKMLVMATEFRPLYLMGCYFPDAEMLGIDPDYGNPGTPWSSQLLRQLINLVSAMREKRMVMLEPLETELKSSSGFEHDRTPLRIRFAMVSLIRKNLHTVVLYCTANDREIASLLQKVDNTPGLLVSEIDREAVHRLHMMFLDMEHLRGMLQQLETEFQEVGERIRDKLAARQQSTIVLLYTFVGVTFLLSIARSSLLPGMILSSLIALAFKERPIQFVRWWIQDLSSYTLSPFDFLPVA